MKVSKCIVYLSIITIFSLCIISETLAAITEIDDFDGAGGPPSGTWSSTATIDRDSQTRVADPAVAATAESCSITNDGDVQIDWAAPGENWAAYTDIAFFVYGANGAQTIDIDIVEGDNVLTVQVDETWSLRTVNEITIDWTGWKYFRFVLGAADFEKTGLTGDDTWNPGVQVTVPPDPSDYDGVKQVKFTIGNNVGRTIYIDEIYISTSGSGLTVYQIFPSDDVKKNDVDITVGWPPPTISAAFTWDPTGANSTIRIVNESAVTQCLNSNTDKISTVAGAYGIFATPDIPIGAGTYTVFIVPSDGTSRGVAEVVRFTVTGDAGTPDIETKQSGTRMY